MKRRDLWTAKYEAGNRPGPIQKPHGMNKDEAEYACILEMMKRSGDIIDYKFESVKFTLADRTTYMPDFIVIFPGHIEFHEIKGFLRDDANVKFKVAATLFPWFVFKMLRRNRDTRHFEIIREA